MVEDKNEYILSINGMSKSFGRNKVLKHINLNVKPGSIMGLMGENGAGKSTMMKCLFGTYQKDEGTIILDGREVNFSGPKDALENGVAMVHQELNQCLERSVVDNLFLGRYPKNSLGVVDEGRMKKEASDLFRKKNKEAVFMISELAKLLRISLSKGRTIIKISDEIQHSRSYMNIQMARYKERFKIRFEIDDEINDYCIVKLVIQPLLENAIYYGVGNMDIDDDGEIIVRGKKIDNEIFITVEDNGMGMREEEVENILKDNNKTPKHGSGVGVINVHSRIKLMFGNEYGLSVESEADKGTKVTIHIPAIPYNESNLTNLEKQNVERKVENEKK